MISVEEEFETFQGGERRDSVIEGCSHMNEEGMGCFNGTVTYMLYRVYTYWRKCTSVHVPQ